MLSTDVIALRSGWDRRMRATGSGDISFGRETSLVQSFGGYKSAHCQGGLLTLDNVVHCRRDLWWRYSATGLESTGPTSCTARCLREDVSGGDVTAVELSIGIFALDENGSVQC